MNVLDLYQHDGHQAKREANTDGGTWGGNCPGCGGEDRFRLQPHYSGINHHEGGRWLCTVAEKRSGDSEPEDAYIGYGMEFNHFIQLAEEHESAGVFLHAKHTHP